MEWFLFTAPALSAPVLNVSEVSELFLSQMLVQPPPLPSSVNDSSADRYVTEL